MLDVILKILALLGIILLILLCVIIVILLIVLFYPVTYQVAGAKSTEALNVSVKINWLLGILRGRYNYPKPGKFVVKLLWITLYDSGAVSGKEDTAAEAGTASVKEAVEAEQNTVADTAKETVSGSETNNATNVSGDIRETDAEGVQEDLLPDAHDETSRKGIKDFIITKYEKIKYTILKIYDKIKHIWENFTFYRDLWRDEQTQKLLEHAIFRLQKIFRNIRPRKLTADIVFGTGSPDTTGYALAVYGMLSPMLGKHVNITPDFTQSILQGEFYMAGHITIFQLVFHSLMVVFDKRLALLKNRINNHKKQRT